MLKTVKQACIFNPIIRDYRMSEAIENLSDLITDQGDGREFFARNYITTGMEQLFREGMLRLDGKSDQAVFELAQAMGGGKTHMMIALGLLAQHPHLRSEVLPDSLATRLGVGKVRVAAFNGRNNPEHYVWGEIATQLGEAEAIKPYWVNGPKSVDQAAWKKIIGDEPTLIMLDELPPYLENASTTVIGQGTLATTITYTLGCLMSAALELPNCCVVIANLSGSYTGQSKAIADTISNLRQEARRQAKTITPVQLAGNEIYEILKKRLILEMPDQSTINAVAEEYAQRIKMASDAGYIVATSLEHVSQQVAETYPFHPSFKHLVALFKENEGFRQTRGLMQFAARLLKSVDERETDDVFLVGAQHFNFNDDAVREEIGRIANSLRPAMTHDVADDGQSIAEEIDAQMGTDAAQQVGSLLLASSLSRAVGGRIGLTEGEIIEFLAAPNRKPDEFKIALEKLREQAWYMHREEQRFFMKETENLSRQIERNARDIPPNKITQALSNRLTAILQPVSKLAYQELHVMPKWDDIKLNGPRVLIVVKPDGRVPPNELQNFFDYQSEKNNLLVLTGQDSYLADVVEERLRELYAVEAISKRLLPGDALFEEARDRLEDAEQRFHKALSGAYNRLYFPSLEPLDGGQHLLPATIDNGLNIGEGDHSAEAQIEQLLASPRANYKLALKMLDEPSEHWAMAEADLWPERDRRTPWKDVVMRAKCNAGWTWMPGASGMDTLKTEALKQGRWRQGSDGYIEKGPFPKDKTAVNVGVQATADDTGETILSLTPRNAGASPVVYYSTTPVVDISSANKVEDLDRFSTSEATLYFLAADTERRFELGEPQRWVAELKVRHQIQAIADERKLTLQCLPAAEMRYTLDGTNPKEGTLYEEPFNVGPPAAKLMVYASAGEASRTIEFNIPSAGDKQVQIQDSKPATLIEGKRISLDSTEKVFGVINQFKGQSDVVFKGVQVQIGDAENTVSIRFAEREVSAEVLEIAINGMRAALGNPQEAVTIQIRSGARFHTGFALKEFATLSGVELLPGDVVQED